MAIPVKGRQLALPSLSVERAQARPGYVAGFPQPALLVLLQLHRQPVSRAVFLERVVQRLFAPTVLSPQTDHALLRPLLCATLGLMATAGLPLLCPVRLHPHPHQVDVFELAVPALPDAWAVPLVVLQTLTALLDSPEVPIDVSPDTPIPDDIEQALRTLVVQIRPLAPKGINTLRFLQAAQALEVPWRYVARNVYQFGWGSRARLLDSSFTDATPTIGAGLARDKHATAQALHAAGIPVPRHRFAADADAAVQQAHELGYPVVVKAADLDAGIGVYAGLPNAAAVRDAFGRARKHSKRILVEQHIAGHDYRLQVSHGQVYWVIQRLPGGVTGDGKQDVADLLRQRNAAVIAEGVESKRKPLKLDEEALALLGEQDLDVASVPPVGQFVRLRRTANVARGGTPVPIDLAQVHPDNQMLAVRAARALRLDLAGIDLLIPDIGRSWLQSGAAVCEVNAQPQMASHLPQLILAELLEGQGRIPMLVVLGNVRSAAWYRPLISVMHQRGKQLGVATPEGVWVDERQVSPKLIDVYDSGLALLSDPQVSAAILQVDIACRAPQGWPMDRADALLVDSDTALQSMDPPDRRRLGRLRRLAAMSKVVWIQGAPSPWHKVFEQAGITEMLYCNKMQIDLNIEAWIEGALGGSEHEASAIERYAASD